MSTLTGHAACRTSSEIKSRRAPVLVRRRPPPHRGRSRTVVDATSETSVSLDTTSCPSLASTLAISSRRRSSSSAINTRSLLVDSAGITAEDPDRLRWRHPYFRYILGARSTDPEDFNLPAGARTNCQCWSGIENDGASTPNFNQTPADTGGRYCTRRRGNAGPRPCCSP
jgi:hypothetical protein